MKPDELFEMLGDIDDKFVDSALPVENDNTVKPQEIRLVKRKFPWGIAAATACVAVGVAVGAVIVMNAGKGKIPVEPNSPAQSTHLTTIIKEAEEIYTETGGKELPLSFSIEELEELDELPHFQIRDDKTIIRLSKFEMNINGWVVFSDKVYVRSVYLCDLNPSTKYDNCRELVAAVTDENGEKSIRAYDFMAQKEYELKIEDYESLTLKDGSLYLCTEDGSAVSQKPLTLQRGRFEMKPVRSDLIPEAEMIYPLVNTVELPLSFTIDELDRKFVIRLTDTVDKPVLFIKNWGESDDWYYGTTLLGSVTVRSVYLCDLNSDGYRELVAAVTAENGDKFVRAYDVKNQKEYEYRVEIVKGCEGEEWNYDSLTLKDGSLYLCTEDETHIDEQPLSLDTMKPIKSEAKSYWITEAKSIYPLVNTVDLPFSFSIDELDRQFVIRPLDTPDKPVLFIKNWGELDAWYERTVFSDGVTVRHVYLRDLNNDGYRELVAAVTAENGDKFIRAYDFMAQKEYELKVEDYDSLTLKDGFLYLCTEDGSAVSQEPLTLHQGQFEMKPVKK